MRAHRALAPWPIAAVQWTDSLLPFLGTPPRTKNRAWNNVNMPMPPARCRPPSFMSRFGSIQDKQTPLCRLSRSNPSIKSYSNIPRFLGIQLNPPVSRLNHATLPCDSESICEGVIPKLYILKLPRMLRRIASSILCHARASTTTAFGRNPPQPRR